MCLALCIASGTVGIAIASPWLRFSPLCTRTTRRPAQTFLSRRAPLVLPGFLFPKRAIGRACWRWRDLLWPDGIHGGIAAAPSNGKHLGQCSLRTLDAFNLLPGALTRAWL
jgi:hypothetical protein